MAEPTEPEASDHQQTLYWPKKIFSFEGYVVLLNAAGSMMIFAIMAMICTDITARYVFNHPIRGVTELTEVFIIGIVFFQLPHAIRLGKLTRSDGAYNLLLTRVPWLGNSLGALYDIAGAVLLFIIAFGAWPKLVRAWGSNFYFGNVGIFTVPEWPVWVMLIIGSATAAIQFVLFAIYHARSAVANSPGTPISDAQRFGGEV